jgi:MEMO1 family protein
MRLVLALLAIPLIASTLLAQAAGQPTAAAPPTLDEVRKGMGIASTDLLRGQQDTVGFASRPEQMARVWELAATTTGLDVLAASPLPGVAGAICPHDDYLYAGRVYRQVLPLVTAKTVVLVGVFHKYRRFGMHDTLVLDTYRGWRTPDGEVPISALRDELAAALPKGDAVSSAVMHDSEHSLEALVFWLRHARPDVEILPIIVPAASFPRMDELADHLATRLAALMKARRLMLGRDVAIVVSSDAVHYGADFKHVPFGEGGIDAYTKACARDRELVLGFSGTLDTGTARRFFEACVNPDDPSQYRLTWCGRFSIPFGLLLLERLARETGVAGVTGVPLSYSTSVGQPELPLRELGMGATAPANLYHFVGYPAVAFVVAPVTSR